MPEDLFAWMVYLVTPIGLFAQAEPTNVSAYGAFAKDVGIPAALLFLVLFGFYKLFWPLLLKQIDARDELAKKQLEIAEKQREITEARIDKLTESSRTQFERMSAEFLTALREQGVLMKSEFDRLSVGMNVAIERVAIDRERERDRDRYRDTTKGARGDG